jgi:hypothetical protein
MDGLRTPSMHGVDGPPQSKFSLRKQGSLAGGWLTPMTVIDQVRSAWSWVGIDPVEVVGENDFGNLILKDALGRYWRLCPEECSCEVIASNREDFDVLSKNQEFLRDWHMPSLVDYAFKTLGVLSEGRKYCLKIPGVLGGEYGGKNIATISLDELIGASGYIAKQIRDLPDGSTIRWKVTD